MPPDPEKQHMNVKGNLWFHPRQQQQQQQQPPRHHHHQQQQQQHRRRQQGSAGEPLSSVDESMHENGNSAYSTIAIRDHYEDDIEGQALLGNGHPTSSVLAYAKNAYQQHEQQQQQQQQQHSAIPHETPNGITLNRIKTRLSCFNKQHLTSLSRERGIQLLFGAFGIYAAYLSYGHVQEDLFRYRTANGQSFQSVWLLQTLESLANVIVGFFGRHLVGRSPNLKLRPFFVTGASQLFAKALTSMALAAGLSFPVAILAKSGKVVPVMLGQLMLGGSQYGKRDYAFCILIVTGTALLSAGSKKPLQNGNAGSTLTGVVFILLSLVMDGVTGGLQKRLKRQHADMGLSGPVNSNKAPTTYDFVFFTSLSMFVVALTISILTADFPKGILFLQENPQVARMISAACLCSAIGQSFVFFVVATFDSFVCSTITTTRKIMSVLWSIVSKGHVLSNHGTLGLSLAMAALALEVQGKIMTTATASGGGGATCRIIGNSNSNSNSNNNNNNNKQTELPSSASSPAGHSFKAKSSDL